MSEYCLQGKNIDKTGVEVKQPFHLTWGEVVA